jgi:hypothetical protein
VLQLQAKQQQQQCQAPLSSTTTLGAVRACCVSSAMTRDLEIEPYNMNNNTCV